MPRGKRKNFLNKLRVDRFVAHFFQVLQAKSKSRLIIERYIDSMSGQKLIKIRSQRRLDKVFKRTGKRKYNRKAVFCTISKNTQIIKKIRCYHGNICFKSLKKKNNGMLFFYREKIYCFFEPLEKH